MVWKTFTIEQLDAISRRLFMPFVLLITYTLMLYLFVFYWSRLREIRVRLLFASAALGVAVLIPFAHPDDYLCNRLNDVSESCSVLAFLLQITIIGRDLNKKIRFRTVLLFTYVAEAFVAVDIVLVLLSLADSLKGNLLSLYLQNLLPTINQTVTLGFVFVFRYYYLIASTGWRDVVMNRKLEAMWYLLFATHMVPWYILSDVSGLPWDPVQAIWHRTTLAGSLWTTAQSKIRTSSSKGRTTIAHKVTNAPTSYRESADGQSPRVNTVLSASKRNAKREPVEADLVSVFTENSKTEKQET